MNNSLPLKIGLCTLSFDGDVATLNIDNGKKNLIDHGDFLDLEVLATELETRELKALVITSKNRHFSYGANPAVIFDRELALDELKAGLQIGKQILQYISELPLLTVAIVNGACFGAGLEIALACDFIFGTDKSFYALPEVTIGLVPGMSGHLRLAQRIGYNRAMQVIISGDIYRAEAARELGIIDLLFAGKSARDDAFGKVREWIGKLSNRQISSVKSVLADVGRAQAYQVNSPEEKLFLELVSTRR